MNVLAVLESDLAEIFQSILDESLDRTPVRFRRQATVCKYVVPQGYPDAPVKNALVDLSRVPADSDSLMRFDAAVEERPDGLTMTGSRAIAFVGIGDNLAEAEARAESAASAVGGPVYHRPDIGTAPLVQRRVDHLRALGA
jgi:phosphoribosylamine-glycine ligase